MWTNICQGLLLVGLLLRFCYALDGALRGRKALPAGGAAGGVTVAIFFALIAVVTWKAGALSTIVGSP